MRKLVLFPALAVFLSVLAQAADIDEFKVKREDVYGFESKPALVPLERGAKVSFTTKGFCDVTVAVEHANGKIVRHLACGVLGKNAPPPFKKDSKTQTLTWDGKDDRGVYIDDLENISIRVSLGLKPQFEKTLFWHPRRRASRYPPLMAAAPEGMYVFDGGNGFDQLRLYDHDGEYLRTVYPFPAKKIEKAQGLNWRAFPQDGKRLPIKPNFLQSSMLTSGTNAKGLITYKSKTKSYRSVVGKDTAEFGKKGGAGASLAVNKDRIALTHILLNRLATDGSTGGLPLTGPKACLEVKIKGARGKGRSYSIPARSSAFSPDGKTLYMTGFVFAGTIGTASADIVTHSAWDSFHAVTKLDFENGKAPEVFAGNLERGKFGNGDKQFKTPTSVACDQKGRVYVSDYLNDRIQVFTPAGKLVKSIKTPRPARVLVHRKSGEIYVFSWKVLSYLDKGRPKGGKPTLTRFSALPEAKKSKTYSLNIKGLPAQFNARYGTTFMEYYAELDSWAKEPTIWMVQEWAMENVLTRKTTVYSNIILLGFEGKNLVIKRNFSRDLAKAKVPGKLHRLCRPRVYFNPKSERLYVAEGTTFIGKGFKEVHVFNPKTGKYKLEQLPFDAEDMCFDIDGRAYLRDLHVVVRYDPRNWREVPWDYGEERAAVNTGSSSGRRVAKAISALPMPAGGGWHHGGMYVSTKGDLAVGCQYDYKPKGRTAEATVDNAGGGWQPRLYPGRVIGGRGGGIYLHVWDRHGQVKYKDRVPGIADNTYGVGLDQDDNLYLLAAATRVLDGKLHFNDMTGTVMKFKRGKGRVVSQGRAAIKLAESAYPKRPIDIQNACQGSAWVEDAEWMYGGVGWMGKNLGIGCACYSCAYTFDYFNRSFAPEMDRYSVAVLDSAGNVILRVGAYGNVDDGKPLVKGDGPPKTQSIGGDEVALFHGAYLATHTDRRLFISDTGNGRVVSVKLGYHKTETLKLED